LSTQVGQARHVCGVVAATRKLKGLTYFDLEGKVGGEVLSLAVDLDTFESLVRKRASGLRVCADGTIEKERTQFVVRVEDMRHLRSAVQPTDPPPGLFGNEVVNLKDLPDFVKPREKKFVEPKYTSEAMRAGVMGMVVLECVVRVDGRPEPCRVLQSLDALYGLDDQALKAVKTWTFYPAQKGGAPVPIVVQLEVNFRLH